jgi:hypothetical protein
MVCYATPDQYSCAATSCWSVCAVADIVGKPGGLSGIKECLTYETYIYAVLSEKVLQLKLPAAHTVRIPAGAGFYHE